MRAGRRFASLWISGLMAGVLCAGCFGSTQASTNHPHRKAAKKPQLPPLPSGPRGPVPQISLESMQAVAPHVTYQGGQLTIVAPNSTLADILRAVRKLTGAEMEIPSNATERVVTNIGPAPAPVVVAELLNGSHFNYVLLGSPSDATLLTRVVLVAKSGPDTTPLAAAPNSPAANSITPQPVVAEAAPDAADADAADDNSDDADQNATAEPEPAQQPAPGTPADTAVKTPQQLLQEMQQRQLQMQQGQPGGQPYVPGGIPPPQRPPQQPPQPPEQQ
ncbi:MAG TPA: hypothetical protein VKR60_01265 [Candidatus Sulfotelmatobacter sp.]|nr:hypothetical protein [Candidatus Sulfotelmatobacter sp.]